MNTYLYAPKDDYKHRLDWRELYTEEQAGMYPHVQLVFRALYRMGNYSVIGDLPKLCMKIRPDS